MTRSVARQLNGTTNPYNEPVCRLPHRVATHLFLCPGIRATLLWNERPRIHRVWPSAHSPAHGPWPRAETCTRAQGSQQKPYIYPRGVDSSSNSPKLWLDLIRHPRLRHLTCFTSRTHKSRLESEATCQGSLLELFGNNTAWVILVLSIKAS